MDISALTSLANSLLTGNSNSSQGTERAPASHPNHGRHEGAGGNSNGVDRYTPSSPSSAEDAFTFQFEQISFSAVNVSSPAAAAPAAAPAVPTASVVAAAPAQPSLVTQPTVSPAVNTANSPSTPTSTQDPLQSLNSSLATLGFSQAEIQAFDQVANLIQQFNPAALQDLTNQLATLASQVTSQSQTNSSAPASSTPTYQLSEFSLKFRGVNATAPQPSQGSGVSSSNVNLSVFSLQIEEVNLTLNGSNGQSTQLQAPQTSPPTAAVQ
jgi:hypothetical protein